MATDSAQNKVMGVLTGISLQIFLAATLFFIMSAATVSSVYSFLVPLGAEAVGDAARNELAGESPDSYNSLRLMSRFNLAWIYVTDETRQPVNGTKPYAPYLPTYLDKSRKLFYHGENYFESVQPLKNPKLKLHLGFPMGSPLKDALKMNTNAALLMPVRLGTLADFCLILALGVTAWVTAVLVLPLNAISKGLNDLIKENKVNLESFEKVPSPPIMVAELHYIYAAVKGLFIYLSTQERSSKEAVKEASERAAKWLKPRAQESDKLEQTLGRSVSNRLSDLLSERGNSQPMANGFADLLKARDSAGNFTGEICSQILEQFKDRVTGVVLLKPDSGSERWLIAGEAGLNTLQIQTLSAMDLQVITAPLATASKISNIGPMSLKRSGLDSYISTLGARAVICAPIRHRNRTLACALLLARDQFSPDQVQILDRTCNNASALYHGLLLAEEAKEQVWTDPLTGLKNRSFIKELMSALGEEPFYFCHITVDTREGLSNSEMESVAQDGARIIKAALRDFENLYKGAINGAEVGRLQKTEYAVLLKAESAELVMQLAGNFYKLLNQFLSDKKLEALGLGIAFSPRDGISEEIMVKAKLASLYAQEASQTHLVRVQELPSDFKPRRRAAAMQGELGVLDAAELLQSLLVGQRSGILTVDEGGRQAKLAMSQGRLLSAKIGVFQGFDAIIEFLSTIESGSFNFQETQTLGEPDANIPPITRCLMEAALAQDHLAAARNSLQDMSSPLVAVKDSNLWQDLLGAEEISQQEQNLLLHILDNADGKKNAEQILREMEMKQVPTAYRYRAVALLINYGLLEKGILSRT